MEDLCPTCESPPTIRPTLERVSLTAALLDELIHPAIPLPSSFFERICEGCFSRLRDAKEFVDRTRAAALAFVSVPTWEPVEIKAEPFDEEDLFEAEILEADVSHISIEPLSPTDALKFHHSYDDEPRDEYCDEEYLEESEAETTYSSDENGSSIPHFRDEGSPHDVTVHCKVCGHFFESNEKLMKHVIVHHSYSDSPYSPHRNIYYRHFPNFWLPAGCSPKKDLSTANCLESPKIVPRVIMVTDLTRKKQRAMCSCCYALFNSTKMAESHVRNNCSGQVKKNPASRKKNGFLVSS